MDTHKNAGLTTRGREARPQQFYLDSSQIQLTSQVLPPSGENDCSMRADLGLISSHT